MNDYAQDTLVVAVWGANVGIWLCLLVKDLDEKKPRSVLIDATMVIIYVLLVALNVVRAGR